MKLNALIMFLVAFMLTSFMIQRCQAAELYLNTNWIHVSQLDAGPPFNDNIEDAVDHVGIGIEMRFGHTDNGYFFSGLSAGRNFNITGCGCWNDGGAEVDTVVTFGYEFKLIEW